MESVQIIVSGKVQGVFFRASAKKIADKLHLTGWVRNIPFHVEIKAFGNESSIQEFIEWCHHGPRDAAVTNVNVQEIAVERFDQFSVIR